MGVVPHDPMVIAMEEGDAWENEVRLPFWHRVVVAEPESGTPTNGGVEGSC